MREANQQIANTFRTFADKEVVDYTAQERKFFKTDMIKKPWEAKKKLFASMELRLDAAIDKVENLSRDVEIDFFAGQQTFAIAEPESKYGAEVFEKYMATHGANSETGDEKVNIVSTIKEEKR